MLKILMTTVAITLAGSAAFACTSQDVEARQGAFLAAMQTLIAIDPAKAQLLLVQMQTELDAAAAANDQAATCDIMDRLLVEATG